MEITKRYVIIDKFEDGWEIDEFSYEELLFEYCTDALFIPEENIEEITYNSTGLEIILSNLEVDDLNEDWFTNIKKLSSDIGIV